MGLEASTYLSGLVSTNPVSGDSQQQGDDHLRLIKSVLKATFPGAGGQGFASAITASEVELNYCDGVTSPIQTQLNAIKATAEKVEVPAGSIVSFFQAAAPTGWTKITTHNNKMLRVVSGAGGGSGGTDSPILNDRVPSHTHAVSVSGSAASNGAHTHTYKTSTFDAYVQGGSGSNAAVMQAPSSGATTGSNGAHTHTVTASGTTAANAGADTWQPLYIDMILCSKNA